MARSKRRAKKPKPEPWPPPTGYERLTDEELESEHARLFAEYVERMEYFACLPPVEQMADGERTEYCHDYVLHMARAHQLGGVSTERGRRMARRARAEFSAMGYEGARAAYAKLDSGVAQYPRMEDGEPLGEYLLRREGWWGEHSRRHGAWRGLCDAHRAEWQGYLSERGVSIGIQRRSRD